jgi:hypothetical protein
LPRICSIGNDIHTIKELWDIPDTTMMICTFSKETRHTLFAFGFLLNEMNELQRFFKRLPPKGLTVLKVF